MKEFRQLCLFAAVLLGVSGCAQQYHCYQGGPCCTRYDYCPPAPLPYQPYCGCVTPWAANYSAVHTQMISPSESPATSP